MTDIKISSLTNDLDLSSNDLQLVADEDAIVQNLRIRYRFFLGEWFLDTREGIPYYERILIKNPNFNGVDAILREVAVDTPGIADVDRFESSFDGSTRELTVDVWARSDTGEPIQFSEPFILTGV